MSEVGHSAQRGTGDWPPSSAAPPQLPNEILPSSGQIGGIARDEVVGGLAAFPLPAGQEKHLGRGAAEMRWKTEASGKGVRRGEGPFAPKPPPPFWLSTRVRAPPLSLLPPSSDPPSSRCPGAGSRRDTGPGPCPSCPGSAGSGPSGPGGQAEARTPGVRPLPRVGMGPCPPSESGQRVRQPQSTIFPSPQQVRSPEAGRATHRFLFGGENRGCCSARSGPLSLPRARQAVGSFVLY